MANQFITVKDFARAALPRLMEHLVFPNLIYKDFTSDFSSSQGDTVQVRKPVVFTAGEFDQQKGVNTHDIVETAVDVTLDKIATVDVGIEALQGATSMEDITRLFIEPAAAALAQKINSDGLMLYQDVGASVGTAGETPSSLAAFAAARKQLNVKKAPVSGRCAVWDPEADAAFTALDPIVHADKCGCTQALREGAIGRVMGMDNYMTQAVKNHESGQMTGTVTVDGAQEEGSMQLKVKGASGTLHKGDLVKVDGSTYAVAGEVNFASTQLIPVTTAIPAMKGGENVTLIPSHTANLCFHPMAFAFVTRPLTAPGGVESYTTTYNGISLRVVRGYDMKYKKEMLSMDVLYGFKTLYPELAVRVLG